MRKPGCFLEGRMCSLHSAWCKPHGDAKGGGEERSRVFVHPATTGPTYRLPGVLDGLDRAFVLMHLIDNY